MLKIDLHVHTRYSYDSSTTLKEVIASSKKMGLDGVAITDHDTIAGALQSRKIKNFIVIPGIEISTLQGHMLALNVVKPIPSKLSPKETIQKIREVGGIVIAPHPTTIYKAGLGIQKSTLDLDALEVINSAAFPFFISTYLNRRLGTRLNLPQTAGSDAHFAHEIGLAYTLIDADQNIDSIIQAIKAGRVTPFGKALSLKMRFQRLCNWLKRIA
ncbi:PHP domain-containing protein [Candidatus Bathyarchaeota archaeon]|nr:PHP domain-containing protein [Candidatus Bathyarchaeota archaeon]